MLQDVAVIQGIGDKSKVVSIGTITKSEKSPHLETSLIQQLLKDPHMTMDPDTKTPPTSVLQNPVHTSMQANVDFCGIYTTMCVHTYISTHPHAHAVYAMKFANIQYVHKCAITKCYRY